VPDEEPGVDPEVALEAREVVGKGLPVPRQPLFERAEGHPLDPSHHPPEVVDIVGAQWREREPAVPGDHRRDSVDVGRRRSGIPQQLRVVVRVRVDDPRRHDQPADVHRARRGLVDVTHRDDPPVADPDVGPGARTPGPVDHGAASQQYVQHGSPPRSPSTTTAPTRRVTGSSTSPRI
jgi:hypothetical protein